MIFPLFFYSKYEQALDPYIFYNVPTEAVRATSQYVEVNLCCSMTIHYRVEVTFAGMRHCKHLPVRTMGRYKIEMSFAELSMKSGPSSKKYGDSVNFLDPFRAGYAVSLEVPNILDV